LDSVQGWTIFEILRYMPEHNWSAYEEALKANPVLAKMMISGVVYSLGDWIAQVRALIHFPGNMHRCNGVITNSTAAYACSATKASRSLISTVLGCSDLGLLGSLFMAHFLITITISVR